MLPLNIRLHGTQFRDIIDGTITEVPKFASNKRIHYLCFARCTKGCNEPQSKCRECFESGHYECYPFDVAVLRKGQTDNYTTKEIDDIRWEERNGKMWFVFKFKEDED